MTQSTEGFRLMGLPLSPYTKKVQSYFDFKGIGYEWIQRSMKNEPLFQQHAKVQLIPLLFLPDGERIRPRLSNGWSRSFRSPRCILRIGRCGSCRACSRNSATNGATS